MIDSHRREDDAPMDHHLHRVDGQNMFPTFKSINPDMAAAILSLVVVLLPGILLKLLSLNSSTTTAPSPLITSPSFVSVTLLVGFILALVSLARSKDNASIRTISIFTLIVCILRFILPS
jgi:FtsH-binding integral membrane protein